MFSYSRAIGYMQTMDLINFFFLGYYMSVSPRTLRTPLISPYTPYTPNTPNNSIELNTSNSSGFPISLKKLILTRCNAWRGKHFEPIETLELLR